MTTRSPKAKSGKTRADLLLVERGLAPTREQAQALIMAGLVYTATGSVLKPGSTIPSTSAVQVRGSLPYVGRGGLKLSHALDHFALDLEDKAVLDVGASTGGFTDCALQRGSRLVYAVDVGHGQLAYQLRQDPRVKVMERTNARYPFGLAGPVDLATIDVSFISVTKVIPSVASHLRPGSPLVVLVKPQFEARKGEIPRGGVIKDPKLHATVLARTIRWVIESGLRLRGLTTSPVLGDAGNREFFLLLLT